MKIRVLGSSSGNPHPERMTSSTLIEGPRGGLLLDAGEGCSQRLQEPGRWVQEVRSILITHRHTDHHAGLPMLLSGCKGFKRQTPLEIIAAQPLLDALRGWAHTLHLAEEDQPMPLDWVALRQGEFASASGHTGEVWKNDHLAPDDMGGAHSLALRLGEQRWVFSADIGTLDSLEPHLPGADGLIVEGWHVDPEEAVTRAKKQGVRRIYLTHVAPGQRTDPIDGARWLRDNDLIDTSREEPQA